MSSKPIVVGVDLADGGDEALRQADAWARRVGAPLLCMHALPEPLRLRLMPESEARVEEALLSAERRADEAVRHRVLRATGRGKSELEVAIERGSPHATLLRLCERVDPLLCAIGASAGFVRLATTTDAVMRHAPCPVLVARPSPPDGPVLVATDLSEHALGAVQAAGQEARRRGVPLLAVHCLEYAHPALASFEPSLIVDSATHASQRAAAREAIVAQLGQTQVEGDPLVAEGSPARVLARVAQECSAALLVVATHGRSALRRLALGSVAAAVAGHAPCSLLVVRTMS